MNYHFTKIFVHLLIIAAVSNFNVFILIAWDAENIYLFKANIIGTLEKVCSKSIINTVDCRCGDFIVNFEHISQPSLMLLFFTMNRQMLFEEFFPV